MEIEKMGLWRSVYSKEQCGTDVIDAEGGGGSFLNEKKTAV
jgi:hypothetical protein